MDYEVGKIELTIHQEENLISPTPKKRRTRKAPLAEISINVPRLRGAVTKKAARKSSIRSKPTTINKGEANLQKSIQPTHLSVVSGYRYAPSTEEDEEFRLTMAGLGQPQRLGIFHDVEENSPGTYQRVIRFIIVC